MRCIVLRSTSPKAFSPGCDIHEFSVCRANKAQAREYGELMHRTLEAFENCPVPVIAEIRGLCVGAGLELAAVCDIRLCCESSRFGAPIKNLGLVINDYLQLMQSDRKIDNRVQEVADISRNLKILAK